MHDKYAEPAAPVDYKGCRIVLAPEQPADETWVCKYIITQPENPLAESSQGYPDGNYPSREAAELAALQKAKAVIDLP